MTAIELKQAHIEGRDITSDNATMGTRIESYRTREPSAGAKLLIPPGSAANATEQPCVPEIAATELNVDTLRGAILEHGGLIVRGMFPQATMDTLREACDRVIDNCADPDADKTLEPGTYFNPPGNLRSIMPNKERELGNTRNFHRTSGSAMCVEAPCVAEALLDMYEACGLKQLVSDYLGEPPCLSVKKWVLRRSLLPVSEAGWHQDGAFMGADINSINMWIPLNECGGDTGAPGMDVVPLRLDTMASAEGAQFDWSVSDTQANNSYDGNPLAPVFQGGDAFFFDHFYLHRTQFREDFTKLRYAIETWFFGESCFPKNQIPLAW